jgi:hypothetical protein
MQLFRNNDGSVQGSSALLAKLEFQPILFRARPL